MPNAEGLQQNPVLLQEACRTYANWLGIPSSSRLPNHYELLGLPLGTSDERQIVAAAGRRVSMLKTLPSEMANPPLQQCLIKQIAIAQKCLLDPASRAAYDAQLKSTPAPRAMMLRPGPAPLHDLLEAELPPLPARTDDLLSQPGPVLGTLPFPARTAAPVATVKFTITLRHLAGTAGGLLLLLFLTIWLFSGVDEPSDVEPTAVAEIPQEAAPPEPAAVPPSTAAETATPDKSAIPPDPTTNTPSVPNSEEQAEAESPPMPGPNSQSTPQPMPKARANPFVYWQKEFTLPPRVGPTSALAGEAVSTQTSLGPLSADAPLTIRLHTSAAALDRGLTLQVVAEEGANVPTWRIEFAKAALPDQDASLLQPVEVDLAQPIARLEHSAGKLVFRWNEACEDPRGDQLRNCRLELTSDSYRHVMLLRKVEQLPAHVLNLTEGEESILTSSEPLPPLETLYLQVDPGLEFADEWVVEPGSQRVRLNEDLRLVHVTAPEAEVVMRLVESGGTLRVQVASYYTLAERRYPFSEEKVRTTLINLQRTFANNRDRIVAAQATGRALLAEMQNIRSAPLPGGPARPAEIARREGMLSDMAGRVRKMDSTISRLQKSLPKTAAAVAEMEQIARLGQMLHQQAQLNFRIGAETLQGDVLLVEIGTQP